VDSSSGLWDRVSSWVSENKAVVYTIAGVAVVVTGAGAVYYLTSDAVCPLSYNRCILARLPHDLVFLSDDAMLTQ
jgi:import receptor subunit TOM70